MRLILIYTHWPHLLLPIYQTSGVDQTAGHFVKWQIVVHPKPQCLSSWKILTVSRTLCLLASDIWLFCIFLVFLVFARFTFFLLTNKHRWPYIRSHLLRPFDNHGRYLCVRSSNFTAHWPLWPTLSLGSIGKWGNFRRLSSWPVLTELKCSILNQTFRRSWRPTILPRGVLTSLSCQMMLDQKTIDDDIGGV